MVEDPRHVTSQTQSSPHGNKGFALFLELGARTPSNEVQYKQVIWHCKLVFCMVHFFKHGPVVKKDLACQPHTFSSQLTTEVNGHDSLLLSYFTK